MVVVFAGDFSRSPSIMITHNHSSMASTGFRWEGSQDVVAE